MDYYSFRGKEGGLRGLANKLKVQEYFGQSLDWESWITERYPRPDLASIVRMKIPKDQRILDLGCGAAELKTTHVTMNLGSRTRDNFKLELVSVLRTASCFLVVSNIPFWLAGRFFPTSTRAPFNLDYLAVAVVGLFLPKALFVTAFVIVFLLDLLRSCASFYYFSAHDLISSVRFISQLPWRRTGAIGLFVVGIALGWALFTMRMAGPWRQQNPKASSLLLIGLILLLVADSAINNSSPFLRRDWFTRPKLANSAGGGLAKIIWETPKQSGGENTLIPMPGASTELLDSLRKLPRTAGGLVRPHNLVVILVESYGLNNDPQVVEVLEAPYRSQAVLERYDVRTGATKFHGATVSAEFRELCGLEMGIGSIGLARDVSQQCLPTLLKRLGYETEAIHGFTGYMFDRRTWYGEVGFEKQLFLEELEELPGMHKCVGAFTGICDRDVTKLIGDQLTSESKANPQFIYWVTLDSHLPTQLSKDGPTVFGCVSQDPANADLAMCNFLGILCRLNLAIAELAMKPNLPPTEFLIVGDHAPPFLASRRRDQFSQALVPFVHLWPKLASPRHSPSLEQSFDRTPNRLEGLQRSARRTASLSESRAAGARESRPAGRHARSPGPQEESLPIRHFTRPHHALSRGGSGDAGIGTVRAVRKWRDRNEFGIRSWKTAHRRDKNGSQAKNVKQSRTARGKAPIMTRGS